MKERRSPDPCKFRLAVRSLRTCIFCLLRHANGAVELNFVLVRSCGGTSKLVPGATNRGFSRLFASAIKRHSPGSSYSSAARWLNVLPRARTRTLRLSAECLGVSCSCSSIVRYSRNVTFSFARNGTPLGLKRLNSSLTLSTKHFEVAFQPKEKSLSFQINEQRGGAWVSPLTLVSA